MIHKLSKLDKRNIRDIFALTPMREGMLFHYLKEPGSDKNCEQLSIEISGKMDTGIFHNAWNFVIDTNEMLHTMFRCEDLKNPVQVILKEHKLNPNYVDLSALNKNEKNKLLKDIKTND